MDFFCVRFNKWDTKIKISKNKVQKPNFELIKKSITILKYSIKTVHCFNLLIINYFKKISIL